MEAKPICVINIPADIDFGGGRPYKWADCSHLQDEFNKNKPDYYWFPLLKHGIASIEFQVFYEKDFTEIKYQELKSMIEEAIKTKIHEHNR